MGAVESVGKSCVGTVGTVGTVGMTLMSGICRLSGTVGFMSGYVGNCRARAQAQRCRCLTCCIVEGIVIAPDAHRLTAAQGSRQRERVP